ncbi:hypothetical protein C0J52_22872, partial [Blattella germanica]
CDQPKLNWAEVVKKGKQKSTPKPVLCGVGTSGNIKVIKKEPRGKAIFVSRFAPEVTVTQISDHLSEMNLKPMQISKLRTKHDTYSSFHVEVEENNFEKLFNAACWPEGCFVSPFYGRLKAEQIIDNGSETTKPAP